MKQREYSKEERKSQFTHNLPHNDYPSLLETNTKSLSLLLAKRTLLPFLTPTFLGPFVTNLSFSLSSSDSTLP